jgi:hypothetical protein
MIKRLAIGVLMASSSVLTAHASNPASDNASNSPYNGASWSSGDNGGFGFGAWSFSNTVTTGGFAGEYVGGTGDGTPAFGLFASDDADSGGNGNSTATATRPFTGGGLLAGQTFSLDLGNTASVATGSVIGLNLLSGSTPEFTFKFTGGQSFWQLNDGGSDFNTNIPFQANTPITFAFTYDGGNDYSVLISDGTNTYTGDNFTANDSISNIDGIKLFDIGQGSGQNIGYNNLNITAVPELSGRTLFLLPALLGTLLLRRRRRLA